MIVEMKGIVKSFAGVMANSHVNLSLEHGEVHALLGENGAGKTTLMNILYGLYPPDAGEIIVRGKEERFGSPRDAIQKGIGMVHQHFMLVKPLSVAENIMLGQSSPRGLLLERKETVYERINALSEGYGLAVDPDREIWTLSVGEQQRVEIIKSLYRGAEVLILDEPTAVLTPQEADELLAIMHRLADEGKTVVFITHKLREVMASCTRVTVLRDGQLVDTVLACDTGEADLARMMVGRDFQISLVDEVIERGEMRMSVRGLSVLDDRDSLAIDNISFDVHSGEIFGIAGVEGNGQGELEQVISGVRKALNGQVVINGVDVTNRLPYENPDLAFSCVPSDRYEWGLLKDFSVAENLLLQRIQKPPYTKMGVIQRDQIKSDAEKMVSEFDIRTSSVELPASALSGGNAQKIILARELTRSPKVILVAQPTRGLDMQAAAYVHQRLLEQRDQGVAILLISTELDEVLKLCDRIAVLYEGSIVGLLERANTEIEELGLMMTGATSKRTRRKNNND